MSNIRLVKVTINDLFSLSSKQLKDTIIIDLTRSTDVRTNSFKSNRFSNSLFLPHNLPCGKTPVSIISFILRQMGKIMHHPKWHTFFDK